MFKTCSDCGMTKPLNQFHKTSASKDGHNNRCKDCRNRYIHEYRRRPDVAEKTRLKNQRYREEGRYANYKRKSLPTPEAARARIAVFRAIKKGLLPHISTCICVKCGNQANHYHHHLGYDEEHKLDVIPLCFSCHLLEHSPHI